MRRASRGAPPRARARRRRAILSAAVALLGFAAAHAAPVRIFLTQTAAGFQQGTLDDVSVDAHGVLSLAARAERVASLGEPFAFALAPLADGWAVGTGNDGRVLEVGRDGAVRTLFDAPEPVVFALWADGDGTLFAGTSPNGKVYRIAAGGPAEVFYDPKETYIWALARDSGGALWVATGTEGRLHRVDASGRGAVAFDSEETHLRSLLALAGGDVLVGTAPSGLVLRWSAGRGAARTLYDSALSEVVAFAPAPDGGAWAAALASESSLLDAAPRPREAEGEAEAEAGSAGEPSAVVMVIGEGESGSVAVSRPPSATGPRSELVRLAAHGRVEPVWSSNDETVFALLSEGARVWAATGLEGKLYAFDGDRVRVEKDLAERQVVGLAPGPTLLTANAVALWRFLPGTERRGSYTSAALDAGQAARFGVFRWRGEPAPGGGEGVRVAFRSGFSAEPDRTWSAWTKPVAGAEIPLDGVPPGRFLQYRLDLEGTATASPRVAATEVSYRQENLRPRIERFFAMDPGQVLVPAGFNPAEQVFEPASPNREGIFTTLEPAASRDERGKTLWKRGWRTLRWKAADANGDPLLASLAVRPEPGSRAADWLEMARELDGDAYGFDASVLPDGVYRFRLVVSDAPGNAAGDALSAEEVSEPVTIDHSPPVVRSARADGRGARLTVYDAASPLREAMLSIDGGEWRPLGAADGLVDGRTEELIVPEIPPTARLALVRLSDAAFNDRAFDLLAELGR
jgi:hypothetical protein